MAKSVLETISEYVKDPKAEERIATAELELELCDRMVDIRLQRKVTQAELATLVGCSQAYVAKLENGAYDRCGIGTLRKFARALGHEIDIDCFLVPIESVGRRRGVVETFSDVSEHLKRFMQRNQETDGTMPASAAEPTSRQAA